MGQSKRGGKVIPKTITCKICQLTVPNPILNQTRGKIVFSTCQKCRNDIIGEKTLKKMSKERAVAQEDTAQQTAAQIIAGIYEDVYAMFLVDFERRDEE